MDEKSLHSGQQRIESLDWLRGIFARMVMVSHLKSFNYGHSDASSILGRFDIYAVSGFFVLSGISIAHAYAHFITNKKALLAYFIRRFCRIWPLLFITVLIAYSIKKINGESIPLWAVFSNATGLFGLYQPHTYFVTGAWSIGNELVYYLIAPMVLAFYKANKLLGNIFVSALGLSSIIYGHYFIVDSLSLSQQWQRYVHPLTNLYFFVVGTAIYFNLGKKSLPYIETLLFTLVALSIFCLFPTYGDQIALVTGKAKFFYSTAIILLCIVFYKNQIKITDFVSRPLQFLGTISYGIYLFHPLIFHIIRSLLPGYHPLLIITATILTTLTTSYFSYRAIERPVIILGKKISSNL